MHVITLGTFILSWRVSHAGNAVLCSGVLIKCHSDVFLLARPSHLDANISTKGDVNLAYLASRNGYKVSDTV